MPGLPGGAEQKTPVNMHLVLDSANGDQVTSNVPCPFALLAPGAERNTPVNVLQHVVFQPYKPGLNGS